MAAKLLALKDMTRGSGCTPRTVRYYERQGLLRATRTAGGHRLFPEQELERLNFIIALREAGWSLDDVTELLGVRGGGPDDQRAMTRLEAMVAQHIARLEHKIEILVKLRDDLQATQGLLPVCKECTEDKSVVECAACGRVPVLLELPRSFRLTWRARELDGGSALFDERGADELEEDAEI